MKPSRHFARRRARLTARDASQCSEAIRAAKCKFGPLPKGRLDATRSRMARL
ncbi:hypothetical protein C7S16_0260 [Burkholderia thailandensis]|uniref:Uncharacterized protein n=1 Tax=Burkholderia thailandensis TaxID=57975 RepID=A0AAW9D239_BURTH|nr:hypothetical protein [Burkholderia thailandensis]MDW9254124.1 hypothetical protein [Burkholderia thailandensis]